ncbi:GM11169 [Drosophila sechellia]|uniref:GM11169 n=1 Tax=Drosophila sechellia TaxID=7238 RepID=B4ING2_DROSE|nr:GM11169 [Drosophila sechellia]
MDVLPEDYAPPQHNQRIRPVRTRCGEKLATQATAAQARESFESPSSFGIGRRRMATVAVETGDSCGGMARHLAKKNQSEVLVHGNVLLWVGMRISVVREMLLTCCQAIFHCFPPGTQTSCVLLPPFIECQPF